MGTPVAEPGYRTAHEQIRTSVGRLYHIYRTRAKSKRIAKHKQGLSKTRGVSVGLLRYQQSRHLVFVVDRCAILAEHRQAAQISQLVQADDHPVGSLRQAVV